MFTILAEAAPENEHVDKATAAMGIAQKLKKEENVVVARGGGSTSEQKGLAPVVARESGGRLERESNVLGESPNLEHVLRYSKENPNCHSLERVAHAGPAPECEGGLQISSVTSSKQPYRAHCWQACALFSCGTRWALHRERALSVAKMPQQSGKTSSCNDEEKLGQQAKKKREANFDHRAAPIAWHSSSYDGAQNPTLGLGQKNDRASTKKNDLSHR